MEKINRYNEIQAAVNNLFTNKRQNYIFVYTPPKVGSTTLVSSLRLSLSDNYNVIHIHDDVMLSVLTGINNVTVNEIISFLANENKKVYVIDIYRTPLERKISEFFEKISIYHFNNSEEHINKYSINRITDRFNKLFPYLALGEHYFDKYGIENPVDFDFNKKYTLQTVNQIEYIKLRLKDVSDWNTILSEVFKREILIVNDYLTDDKKISKIYGKFKQEYKVPSNLYNLLEDNKYLMVYLTDDERIKYLTNIKSRMVGPVIPYTPDEYKFYINLCLENQFFNDVQTEHYIDCGCICKACSEKRVCLFNDVKNGGKINRKITHETSNVKVKMIKTKVKRNVYKNSIYNLSSVISMRK
jgi:hypothetical protein